MPLFFRSKSRPQRDSASTSKGTSTPAPVPVPPPKDGIYDYDYNSDYGPASETASNLYQGGARSTYAHKQPTTGGSRARRTSTPAYTTGSLQGSQSAQSLPSRRPLLSYASYTAQPRRPSPLTGPPIVAPSSHLYAHSNLNSQLNAHGLSPSPSPSHLRPERPTIQRPYSEVILSSSPSSSSYSASGTRADTSAPTGPAPPRPDSVQRSISVVGDDWTRAYAAVEYELDLDAELDRELDRRFKRPSASSTPSPSSPLRPDEYQDDENADGGNGADEGEAMLAPPAETATMHKTSGAGGTQTISTTQTRHARTPSAGWRAWSGDYDDVDVVAEGAAWSRAEEQALLQSPASSSPPPLHALSPASAPASQACSVITPSPATPTPSLASPHHLPSLHSSHSTPNLHSTSTSSHSRTSMASHKMNAPLPPLPSPVRSPMLDKARSRSHEPIIGPLTPSSPLSVAVPPPTPPKQNASGPSMLAGYANVPRSASVPPPVPDAPQGASAHARAATATDKESTASLLPYHDALECLAPLQGSMPLPAGVAQAPLAPQQVVDPASHTDAPMRLQQPHQLVLSPSPSSLSGPTQPSTQPTPEIQEVIEVERPAPPFLVLSSKAPPPSVVVPFPSPPLSTSPSPPIAIASSLSPLPSIASQTSPASSSSANANARTKANIIPAGGAPQLRNPAPFSQPAPRPTSLPAGLPPALPSLPSFTSSSLTPSSLSSSTPPSSNSIPPHSPGPPLNPYARQPTSSRASMILYHVTLPSSSRSSPLAHEFSHEYRSFGTLGPGVHPRVAEDGMLLPPVTGLSASASASSSSFNLLSSFFAHGHSQSRSGSPSASASNLHAASASGSDAPLPQSFTSPPPPPPPLPSPPANRYSTYSAYSTSRESIAAPSYTSTTRGGGGSALVLASEDRDSKYNVGLMIGTIKSSGTGTMGYSTLPRVGTPLAASFGLADLAMSGLDEKQMDGGHIRGETGSVRGEFGDLSLNGSVRGGGGGLVAYAYDPDEDDSDDELGVEGDWLHDPDVWPYADGKGDVHARRGDWKPRWWRRGGSANAKAPKPLASRREKLSGRGGDGEVQMQMLESGAATVSRPGTGSTTMSMSMSVGSRASIMKSPLPSPTGPSHSHPHSSHPHLSHPSHPHPHQHSYLPPYQPPSTLDTLLGRGAASAFTLVLVVGALMVLFIVYPVVQVYGDGGATAKILGNTAINATGQAVVD